MDVREWKRGRKKKEIKWETEAQGRYEGKRGQGRDMEGVGREEQRGGKRKGRAGSKQEEGKGREEERGAKGREVEKEEWRGREGGTRTFSVCPESV